MDLDMLGDALRTSQIVRPAQLLSNLPSRLTLAPVPASHAGAVITKIEDIIESMLDCILNEGKELVINLKTCRRSPGRAGGATSGGSRMSTAIRFPNKSPKQVWKFTALLRILEFSHEALVTGIITTKRDIYYRDPELFIKQAVVDRYVDDIAYTLGVGRDALNVVAAAKGLVAGAFTVTRKDESMVDYSLELDGILIPNRRDIVSINLVAVGWILVVEKEATFRTLATTRHWESSSCGKGIIVTAKGYPDIQTRQFLHLLSATHPEIPIYCLVDYDPDGIGIMSTYKHGSAALAHEEELAVPSIGWLGVRSRDIFPYSQRVQEDRANNMERSDIATTEQVDDDNVGLLRLTPRDRRNAMRMLERDVLQEGREDDWRRELQVMLMMGVKAEIQILGNGVKLGAWVDAKLKEKWL